MKNNLSEKILYAITIFLIINTIFLSLIFSLKKGILVFFFLFLLIYWQRKRLQDFLQKIKNPKVGTIIYLLTGWAGMIFFEFQLKSLPFHPKPLADLVVGLGFYLPYFFIWLILIKHYQLSHFEVFYLSGLGRLIFDFLVTRKILTTTAMTTSALAAFLVMIAQVFITLVLFGALTTLPVLFLKTPENKNYRKPVEQYLISLTPHFLAGGIFIIWTIILKMIVAKDLIL
jgi:hypothetical protein